MRFDLYGICYSARIILVEMRSIEGVGLGRIWIKRYNWSLNFFFHNKKRKYYSFGRMIKGVVILKFFENNVIEIQF